MIHLRKDNMVINVIFFWISAVFKFIISKEGKVSMQVKVRGNSLVIIVNGDLDHHNAEIIKEIADSSIMENKIRNVIFDFKNSNFMDSSGIGVMMGRYKLIANAGGRTCAVNLSPAINRIFQVSGLHKVIERFENVEEALKEYQKEFKDE